MSLLPWQFLSSLETLHQRIQAGLTSLVESNPRSTIWISTNDSNWISEIGIHETEANVLLEIRLPDIQLADLDVQVSPETAVIRARSAQDEVEGFFRADQLENTIPLPISVHPETVYAELQDNILTLTLPKSGRVDRHRHRIAIPIPNNHSADRLQESVVNR